ncbi:MAG: CvpA family protein [bacterium]|nr:CvpA family protein [bacterium]
MSPLLLDLIFVVCAIAAIYAGYKRGFLGQVVWLVSSFIGFGLAARFSADLAELFGYGIVSKPITIAVSFLLIFVLAIWLARMIGKWVTGMIKESPVGMVNSIIGAICSLGIFLVIASLIMVVAMVIVPGARTTVEQTYVVQGILTPVSAILDERLLHRGDEQPGATQEP